MRRVLSVLCLVGLVVITAHGGVEAARPLETEPLPPGETVELVVFEVDGCTYCGLFRRDVLPAYLLSPRAGEVPIRFVDLNDGTGGLKLDTPIDVVPTAVLVKNNRETGRITGYSGPESFFHLMRYLLSRTE